MMERHNLRNMRADVLGHEILSRLRPFIEPGQEKDAYNALISLLRDKGVEIITDDMRKDMGLPPRGPDGWTVEEMMALEQRRLEILHKPAPVVVVKA